MSDLRELTSTYRLQLHRGFDFAAAAAIVPYLAELGISHLYLSPVLQATPGSMHGYDVVDHSRIADDLGGREGLEALGRIAHEHGLGVVVDVVPNHMALPTPAHLNAPLWEVLRLGRDAPTAHWFDIDWDLCDGRLGLPILGATVEDAIAADELTVGEHDGQPVLRYYEQALPLAPGTSEGPLREVLERQHYLLADWHDKDEVLGYRRFFDVDTLVAIRVELDDVFDASHALLTDLHAAGTIDGFRIDHPDGLADPQGYLERLRAATDGAWVVVEKILEGDERLPGAWAAAGTTGYDAAKAVMAALVPPTGDALTALWTGLDGADPELHATEHAAKLLVLADLLQPELRRLVRRAVPATARTGRELTASRCTAALTALLADVVTYRAYVRLDEPVDASASALLDGMRRRATTDHPELAEELAVLSAVLGHSASTDPDVRDLVVRFQQVCGPVMAKGVEDTTFYRWHRFVALNEVGGDPLSLDRPERDTLHTWAARQQSDHPTGMTTLSTHDTKRGEDVRAQLFAAGEDVDRWTVVWAEVRERARELGVDEPTAYLVMQTVLGAWPIGADRLEPYLRKAVREAKQHTTWNDPDTVYEGRVLRLGRDLVAPGPVADLVADWLADLAPAVRSLTLGTKLVQLLLPGVPDVYQGTELVERFLVDPDNRRLVDFGARARRLGRLDGGASPRDLDDEKLWVTAHALRLRRDRPELFGEASSYRPLTVTSPHVLGFVRSERVAVVVTRWPLGLSVSGWCDATVELPQGRWTDLLSGRSHDTGSARVDRILDTLPVALLAREDL